VTGPIVSVNLERDRVIARLSDAFAHDALGIEAFEERLTHAHRADTIQALEALVADLPAPLAIVASPNAVLSSDRDRPATRTIRCVFSGIERSGPWTVPRQLAIRCVFGGADLDLREADFGPGVTDLEIKAVFAGVRIIVPPGLQVEMDGSAIFGGFQHLERSSGSCQGPTPILRVTGKVVFGGVEIETRLPGESERDAASRHRGHRRQLRSGGQAAPLLAHGQKIAIPARNLLTPDSP
jgi:hypothetical protein